VSDEAGTFTKAKAVHRYCPERASARFRPAVPADRTGSRCSCTSGAVDYDPNPRSTSDGSVARYYDPVTGQFLSLDPDVAQTMSPFTYASDNPINENDPSGLLTATGDCAEEGGTWINNPSPAEAQSLWFGHCLRSTNNSSLVGSVGRFIVKHRKGIELGIGIALGVAAAATGVGAIIEGATAAGFLLASGSLVLGLGATALDYGSCVKGHQTVACVGLGLGGAGAFAGLFGAAGAGLVLVGVITEDGVTAAILGGLGAFGWNVGIAGTVFDATTGIASADTLPAC
jgi:RHS repeat-associated protein